MVSYRLVKNFRIASVASKLICFECYCECSTFGIISRILIFYYFAPNNERVSFIQPSLVSLLRHNDSDGIIYVMSHDVYRIQFAWAHCSSLPIIEKAITFALALSFLDFSRSSTSFLSKLIFFSFRLKFYFIFPTAFGLIHFLLKKSIFAFSSLLSFALTHFLFLLLSFFILPFMQAKKRYKHSLSFAKQ